uniref:Uncharacterized protein n=1 Tax=Anguilla anguilla TaxID=7936 RepID=A0A0E9XEK3_ANGAN
MERNTTPAVSLKIQLIHPVLYLLDSQRNLQFLNRDKEQQ